MKHQAQKAWFLNNCTRLRPLTLLAKLCDLAFAGSAQNTLYILTFLLSFSKRFRLFPHLFRRAKNCGIQPHHLITRETFASSFCTENQPLPKCITPHAMLKLFYSHTLSRELARDSIIPAYLCQELFSRRCKGLPILRSTPCPPRPPDVEATG